MLSEKRERHIVRIFLDLVGWKGAVVVASRLQPRATVESKLMASTNVKVVPFRTLSTGARVESFCNWRANSVAIVRCASMRACAFSLLHRSSPRDCY